MIDAGSRRFIVWVNQNILALMQEQEGGKYGGGVSSTLLGGELKPDTPTTITLELDAPGVRLMSSVDSASAIDDVPLHAVDVVLIRDTPPASIRAVHVGSVPGVKSQPSGTYSIDDIKIE